MSEPHLDDIERALGHAVDPARQGAFNDLYAFPRDLLEDARKLRSRTLAYRFLRYYTTSSVWPWLPEFVDDVVERNGDPESWRRGGILVPHIRLETLIASDVAEILALLEPGPQESWLQVTPDWYAWDIGEDVTGAPAVERPDLRYDSDTSGQVRRVFTNGLERLNTVDDIVVATRRWMASRIARQVSTPARPDDPEALLKAAFPTVARPSGDALLAARGLLHESRSMGPSDTEVPGFRGPSNWYR